MIPHLDTSALAKWCFAEPRPERVAAWLADIEDAAISRLTMVEMRCLLARRPRARLLAPDRERLVYGRFMEQVAAGYRRLVPMPETVLLDAVDLIERRPAMLLRTLDAPRLAAAQLAAATTIAAADALMRAAAAALSPEVTLLGAGSA